MDRRPISWDLSLLSAETVTAATSSLLTCFPGARAAGVGSRLLRAAENRLRAANCDGVILETAVDNFAGPLLL